MESLQQEINVFLAALDLGISHAMQENVADGAKQAIADAVQTEVYDAYPEGMYQRRGIYGGLQDKFEMDAIYDDATHTLEVTDNRRDEESGRLVAPVVESGKGYNFPTAVGARPFHRVAEEFYAAGMFELDLVSGLQGAGIDATADSGSADADLDDM